MEDKHSDELLRDLLHDAAPAEFRAALLAETLHQVRRRKSQRQRNRVLLVAAGMIAVTLALWRTSPTPTPSQVVHVQAPIDPLLIHSQPLPPAMIIATDPTSVGHVETSPNSLSVINTAPHPKLYQTIGDDELLTLLAGTAVLVRQNEFEAEVFFVPQKN